MFRHLPLALASVLLSAFSTVGDGAYMIAEDYAVRFDTRAASGTISGLVGEIVFDPAVLNLAHIDVTVQVATIATGYKIKDGHARGRRGLT